MTLYRFSLLGLLMAVALLVAACGDYTERLHGAWKSDVVDSTTGKPNIVIFTKDTVNVNGKTSNVTYKVLALNIDVLDAASNASLFVASKIEKETLDLQGDAIEGSKAIAFKRIPDAEAQQLLGSK